MFQTDREAVENGAAERLQAAYDRLVIQAATNGQLTTDEQLELRDVLRAKGGKLKSDYGGEPSFEHDVGELQRAALLQKTLAADLKRHGIDTPDELYPRIGEAKELVKQTEKGLREAKGSLVNLRNSHQSMVQTTAMLQRLRECWPAYFASEAHQATKPVSKKRA